MVNKCVSSLIRGSFCMILIAGCASAVSGVDARYSENTDAVIHDKTSGRVGECIVSISKAYFWRDWMPIVSRPGPDRGSQLHATITLQLENPSKEICRLAFRALLIDRKGRTSALPLEVMPNYRVLPQDIAKQYRQLTEEARRSVIAKYNVIWDGSLQPGESRLLELFTPEGPYWPVGSYVYCELTWTDENGMSNVVKTFDEIINRTD